ncbi:four helix bundle protein [Paramaledivibacter caminithermalis]|jgi:four helix bundle protein|uniref:Four helix bundle protein n=1 Tax=Paramaledivibacter caminithermalis (strain DSM 15212 / CIP 107654 / DViRD3) TaxID=1121301 RepID=A0A1M6KF95_PARC5|nr:four helix bundle protein [Paramaledivibacter caminithermalis]SHJ57665.1 four helix bundle protein [Paramaledivibacter caminithermalis DSM 15212]
MYKTFNQMPIWKQAMNISMKVFKLSDKLPRKEDYGLTSQVRRSANSIGANIAEGFGRKHLKDKKNFYIFARGSVNETIHHLIYGVNIGYFNEDTVDKLIQEIKCLIYEINKVVKTLENWKPKI